MFSTPETSVHVRDENREMSPLERAEGYGGKDLEKRWVLRREWKTLWDTPTTDLGAESEPDDWGEHSMRWPTDKEREEMEEVCFIGTNFLRFRHDQKAWHQCQPSSVCAHAVRSATLW